MPVLSLPFCFLLANSHRCVCSAEASQCPWVSRIRCSISLLPLKLLAGTCGPNFCISCSVLEGGGGSLLAALLWVLLWASSGLQYYQHTVPYIKSPLPKMAEWAGESSALKALAARAGDLGWSQGPMRQKERSTSMHALSLWVLCMQVCVHTGK